MSTLQDQAKSVFDQALEIESEEQRRAYLSRRFEKNPEIREPVEDLLSAFRQAGSLLDFPPVDLAATTCGPQEALGTTIGPYKLLQKLGEGGMGVVYLAERQTPVKQRVALKLVKLGMDSKKFVARFEAERQALAMMDHPNIARVLDAGCTESGRPYFVMELVKGVPICQFCDENRLSTRERLQLFVPVCEAVNHAHQKGIIHRDIKPSNVLVAQYDDKPVPKVIDFGVAKATHQQLTDKTLFTEVGSILGTLEYMSPEQAVLNQLDVDTRTDIYSLGVLLYELLTGETPLDRSRLRKAQLLETLRMIREEEPAKPSTRISSLGERLTTRAAYRGSKPGAVAAEMRGDLDWIVMKALSKERARRYDTASRFSEDIQRHLNNELVEARPPSVWYQLQKFYQRNRALSRSLAAVIIALTIGLAGITFVYAQLLKKQQQIDIAVAKEAVATMSEAVVASLKGDRDRAEDAIEFLQRVDKTVGDVTLVKSLIALNESEYAEARRLAVLSRSQESKMQGPSRCGARSVIVAAELWGGYEYDSVDHRELLDLKAGNDFEALLQAYAAVGFAPAKSLSILKHHPNISRTTVGTFVLGQANLLYSVDQDDGAKFEAAFRQLAVTHHQMNGSDSATMFRAFSLFHGIIKAQAEVQSIDAKMLIEEIRPLINHLEASRKDLWLVWQFYRAIDDLEGAMGACRLHATDINCEILTYESLLRGDYELAWEAFQEMMQDKDELTPDARLAAAHIVRGLPNGEARARELIGDLHESETRFIAHYALTAYCLVSNVDDLESRAKETLAKIPAQEYSGDQLWRIADCIRYFAGDLSESQLVNSAGNHQFTLAMAYRAIAMKALAGNNRNKARQYFQLAVDTKTVASGDYHAAEAYLKRMLADESWPHWLDDETEHR